MKKEISWTLKAVEFPAGTVAAGFLVSLSGAGEDSQMVPEGQTAAVFELGVGDYVASVVRIDANGNALGAAATKSFTVDAPATVTVMVPDVVSVNDAVVTIQVVDQVNA